MENFRCGGPDVAFWDSIASGPGSIAYRPDGGPSPQGPDLDTANDAGGGYYLGWIAAEEWVEYEVTVSTAQAYLLQMRYAAPNGAFPSLSVLITNGDFSSGPYALIAPPTGGWDVWADTPTLPIVLFAGTNTIRFTGNATATNGNFNYFDIVYMATPTSTPTFTPTPAYSPTPPETSTPIYMPTFTPTPTSSPTPTITPTATPVFTTSRVSIASDGAQGNQDSTYSAISDDGRYVTFISSATNLVSDDTNGWDDVFIHDRQTGQTSRVSIASDGTEGNSYARFPAISADGRYVTFDSLASNLISGDDNDTYDVFVHDRQTGQTSRISVASNGTEGNGESANPSISADGRYIAFSSRASNLVSGDGGGWDVFVYDQQTSQTALVSVASDGAGANGDSWGSSISADGRYVAFISYASNLVSGDTNGVWDIFVHDRQTGQTTRVSVASDGTEGNNDSLYPSISADGRYVAFDSRASNLVNGDTNGSDIFVHDRQTMQTNRVSVTSDGTEGNGDSVVPSISADGRYIAFTSQANNLVNGDNNNVWDIFIHDWQTAQTSRVSIASNGAEGNASSHESSISGDARYVAFESYADNLVSGDTDGFWDIFVHDRGE